MCTNAAPDHRLLMVYEPKFLRFFQARFEKLPVVEDMGEPEVGRMVV